jgi:hypothetical protein
MKTIFLPIFLFVCFVNTQAQNDTTWHVIESGILNSGISTLTGTIDGTVVPIAGWELAEKPFDKFYNSSNPTKEQAKIEGLLKPRSNKDRLSKTKKLIDSLRQALKECEEKNLPNLKVTSKPAIMGTAHPVFYEVKDNPISRDLNIWLLKLLDQYAKECYADSTLQHTHNSKWNDNCFRQTGNLAVGYSYTIDCKDSSHYSYTHRIPTFEDFTTWLRKQSNK